VGKVRIVVDSAADFTAPTIIERYHVSLVPHKIQFGAESYLDRQTLDAEGFFKRASREDVFPQLIAPTVEQYVEVFTSLSKDTDRILSLHTSRTLSASWQNAKLAADTFLGRCNITVVDSMTTTAGLGMLTELAARTAEQTTSLDDIVRLVRGAIPRIYTIFFVETLDYIRERALLGEAQAILGTMLGIKPFLTIEEGNLVTMEKVRTRSQAVDKLVEFVLEFGGIEQLVILQNSPYTTDTVRSLLDRLAAELGKRDFPTLVYGPTLACALGLDATGIVVLEKEEF
jgi:DegV family protein with EDD domain